MKTMNKLLILPAVGRNWAHPWLLPLALTVTLFLSNAEANSPKGGIKQHETPLRMGLLPHMSTELLMKKYRKLIVYLEQQLGRPIIVNTAPNFKTYIERTAAGKYDFYLTAPHLAAYHEKHHQHRRVARFARSLHGVIVVAKDAPYRSLEDLHGKVFAAPDQLAIITLLGEVALIDSGLKLNEDITIKYRTSHNSALTSVAEGIADAAVSGISAYTLTPEKVRSRLRILTKTQTIPHMMFLTSDNLSQNDSDTIKDAFMNFTADGDGKAFFADAAFKDMTPIADRDMAHMEIMLPLLDAKLAP